MTSRLLQMCLNMKTSFFQESPVLVLKTNNPIESCMLPFWYSNEYVNNYTVHVIRGLLIGRKLLACSGIHWFLLRVHSQLCLCLMTKWIYKNWSRDKSGSVFVPFLSFPVHNMTPRKTLNSVLYRTFDKVAPFIAK